MKRTILFPTLLAVLLAGCTMAEPNTTQGVGEEGLVKFTANAATTKVSISVGEESPVLAWEAGDQVGIFDLAEDASRNYCYNVNPAEEAIVCSLTPDNKQKAYYGTDKEQTFYAYYPYNAETSEMACEFPLALPRVQTQAASGDIQHLSEFNFMAAQTTVTDGGAANLEFESVFAFIRFDVLLNEAYDVQIKQLRLKSTATPLAMAIGTIDLTNGYILPIEIDNDITLAVEDNLVINNTEAQQGYMMVLPGSHAEGTLSIEVVAIDNSVATVALPAVTFKANGYYERELSISIDDFVQGNPFNVTAESLAGTVGEPVQFSISGVADSIGCYTGEEGHDYEMRNTDRVIADTQLLFSFTSQYQSGGGEEEHPELFRIKISQDFSGNYTEEDVLAATWIDITELYNLPDHVSAGSDWKDTTDSGVADLISYIEKDKEFYIGMFYHISEYDDGEVGRTIVYVVNMLVESVSDEGEVTTIQDETTSEYCHLIHGESFASDKSNQCQFFTDKNYYGSKVPYFRFFSDFKPVGDRYAYMVTEPFALPYTNLGPDTPIVVQSATDSPVSEFSYTFNEAGTYEVVFVAHSISLTGEAVEEVKTFTITIEEN